MELNYIHNFINEKNFSEFQHLKEERKKEKRRWETEET